MVVCRSKVRSPDERTYGSGSLRLNVKRQSVFEDSFNKLRSKTPSEMRAKLSVAFVGEEGIDAGGVSREWYQVSHNANSSYCLNYSTWSWSHPADSTASRDCLALPRTATSTHASTLMQSALLSLCPVSLSS